MKSYSVADFAILGVIALGGYSVWKMTQAKAHPQTIDECVKLLESMPKPYLDGMMDVFHSNKRGKELSTQIDDFADLLEKDGLTDEAKCFRDYKPQITADIESTEVIPES